MKLFIFRHAQRAHSTLLSPFEDPGLTEYGERQARNLVIEIENKKIRKPTALWCSPRERAQQTFRPLAQALQLNLNLRPELQDRQSGETRHDFILRIRASMVQFESRMDSILFVCTHHDWIDEFLNLVSRECLLPKSALDGWQAGQFLEFDVEHGIWTPQDLGVLPG